MPNWVVAIIGVVIGGTIQMVADWFRHRRYPAERTIDRVIEQRLTAYRDLWAALMRAHTSAASWPFKAEDTTLTRGVEAEMVELGNLLITGDIWLSPKIAQISWKYMPGIHHLIYCLKHEAAHNNIGFQQLLLGLLTELGEGISKELKEELKAARLESLSMAERQKSLSEGFKIVRDIRLKEKPKGD